MALAAGEIGPLARQARASLARIAGSVISTCRSPAPWARTVDVVTSAMPRPRAARRASMAGLVASSATRGDWPAAA
jgi:hypothetical protein